MNDDTSATKNVARKMPVNSATSEAHADEA